MEDILIKLQAKLFKEKDELIKEVTDEAIKQNFILYIRSSNSKRGCVELYCDQGPPSKDHKAYLKDIPKNSRITSSKKLNCKFKVNARKYSFNNKEYWVITSFNSQHSHPLNSNILFHPTLRKMDSEFEEYVYQLHKSGTTPRSILNILKFQFSDKIFIPKDI
ncbi:hypothetical protein CONCODRAFT_13422 [Conidiobolus coronatus NRRL 28638]|uniref:FAR1 domain-containing protein n=1 Tax=Conidiobolus coronatus (strain ATCC 28846 / CBS 209.66 / NRRL 28638) TaxID=796925 RepID=A0A137NQV5_CONC2|nr:hypothetical protein CONCODRAFT_13422 [Conidiobolus coronatus NRRL 28638]|eukprot:KXN65104.1 hypothetical protein CONCODRAFT_13422 [Conidiobolus coronatus NRRL 28638]